MQESEITVFLLDEELKEVKRVAHARTLVAVVLTKSGSVQFMPLVRVIAELRGLELSEVAPRLANSSGIVLRDATKDEADAVCEELRRQDVPYVLIPTRELPEYEEVAQLFRIRVGNRGIRMRRNDGTSFDVKWNNILTITCVRLEASSDSGGKAPARLILSIITREPFACYQLSQNIPALKKVISTEAYEPGSRFERTGRAIYESFPHSSQNKGMRILSSYGLKGSWLGLTFERLEEVQNYNYWVALLRKHQLDLRKNAKPRFSVPWLRKIEFEAESGKPEIPTRYRVRSGIYTAPPIIRQRPPILLSQPQPAEWIPIVSKRMDTQSGWLNVLTVIAAICLAIFIILELAG